LQPDIEGIKHLVMVNKRSEKFAMAVNELTFRWIFIITM
jgi:hypothetical protein